MNPAAILSLVTAGLSLYAALLAARFSRAPGWSEQKWFAAFSGAAGVYAVADLVSYLPVAEAAVTALSRAQLALAAAQTGICLRYSDVQLRRAAPRVHGRTAAVLAGLGLIALVPGAVFTGRVTRLSVGSVTYRIPEVTALGDGLIAAVILVLGAVAVRFGLAARRGEPRAWLHAAGFAVLVATAANDSLVVAGAIQMPFLVDLGIVAAIGAVGLALAGRFVDEARLLHDLRWRLEEAVAERSGTLVAREAELARTGQLAALGRLAAGVAHDVAGPAAAAASNVRQVLGALRQGELPEDAVACLSESEEALARITRTLRMLHDAERVAMAPGGSGVVQLSRAVEESVEAAQMRGPAGVGVVIDVADALRVKGEWRVVTEVLTLLLSHLRQEAAAGSRVTVRAEPSGERVRISLERLPAASRTPAPGAGEVPAEAGLGLAVVRGLAGSLGGSLTAEGGAGGRLRVVLELPAGYT